MIVFRVSVGIGFLGYALLLLEFSGLGILLASLMGPAMPLTGGWWQGLRVHCRSA